MTNDKDSAVLLSCPFCGAQPHHGLSKIMHDGLHGDPYQRFLVWCPKDHAKVDKVNREQAFAAWNTRTPDPQVTALVQAAGVLAYAEAEYRWKHDSEGDGHIETGRAWDRMRNAGKKVAAALAALQEQSK